MRQSIKTYLKVFLNLATALLILLFCIFILPKCIWFFMPFIIGWIISSIASPVVRFFEEKLKVRRKAVSAVVIVAVLAVVVLLVYLLVAKLIKEGIYNRMPVDMQNTLDNIGQEMGNYFSGIMTSIELPSFAAVGSVAKQIPDVFLSIVICLLSAYFFVADKAYMANVAERFVPRAVRYRFDLIRRSFSKAIGGYFKAQFKIECWVYILLVIGLMILDVNYAFLVALGIAFLDFLPVFGTGTVMLPWAVIEFLSKDYRMMFGLLVIWLVGQLVRQVIQPKIVGDSIGVDAIPTLFLLYIGYRLAGMLGMILAVPIGIILMNLYEEGVFDTTRQSLQILVAGFNRFRRIRAADMAIVADYEREAKNAYQMELQHEQEKAQEWQEASQLKIEEPPILRKIIARKAEQDKGEKKGD